MRIIIGINCNNSNNNTNNNRNRSSSRFGCTSNSTSICCTTTSNNYHFSILLRLLILLLFDISITIVQQQQQPQQQNISSRIPLLFFFACASSSSTSLSLLSTESLLSRARNINQLRLNNNLQQYQQQQQRTNNRIMSLLLQQAIASNTMKTHATLLGLRSNNNCNTRGFWKKCISSNHIDSSSLYSSSRSSSSSSSSCSSRSSSSISSISSISLIASSITTRRAPQLPIAFIGALSSRIIQPYQQPSRKQIVHNHQKQQQQQQQQLFRLHSSSTSSSPSSSSTSSSPTILSSSTTPISTSSATSISNNNTYNNHDDDDNNDIDNTNNTTESSSSSIQEQQEQVQQYYNVNNIRKEGGGTRALRRQKRINLDQQQPLDFESNFEFSANPRWDKRFNNDLNTHEAFTEYNNSTKQHSDLVQHQMQQQLQLQQQDDESLSSLTSTSTTASASGTKLNSTELNKLIELEAIEDKKELQKLQNEHLLYNQLDTKTINKAIQLLYPYVKPQRIQRIESVLQSRTQQTRFLFENPVNPSNVFACLRTLDAFGIQIVDIIIDKSFYIGKSSISQKRGMRTATGSAQWLTINYHLSTIDAIQSIKQQYNTDNNNNSNKKDVVFYATDVNPSSQDIRTIDWSSNPYQNQNHDEQQDETSTSVDNNNNKIDTDPCICIVMGNEERGISTDMRNLIDYTFTLPMVGFAESFNLSVATAITLAHLSSKSSSSSSSVDGNTNKQTGPIRPGDISEHYYNILLLKGLLNSVAQKRIIEPLFKKENIILPPELYKSL